MTGAARRAALALLAAAALAPHPLAGQGAPPGWPVLTGQFDNYVKSDQIVGATLAWVRDGRIVARHHLGLADVASGRVVDDSTLWHWASNTKTLTAVATLQLRDRGLLSLDDPAIRWVPELQQVHNPYGSMDAVTVRMLLSHSSGFQNPTWPYGSGASWEPFEPTKWSQLVAMMPWQELRFPPGSRYGYSNPAYIYLARIIEHFTGDPWITYVRQNLWTPLGMTRSYVNGTPPYLAAHRSNRYYVERDSGGTVAPRAGGPELVPGVTIPNGGWNGPVDDVATWIAFMTGRPGDRAGPPTLIARATLAERWTPVVLVRRDAAMTESMGLGFFRFDVNDHHLAGHTGDQGGFRSVMAFDPSSGEGVIGVVNTSNGVDPNSDAGFTALFDSALQLLAR